MNIELIRQFTIIQYSCLLRRGQIQQTMNFKRGSAHMIDYFNVGLIQVDIVLNKKEFGHITSTSSPTHSCPGSLTPIIDTTILFWLSHTNTRHNNIFMALSHQYPTQEYFPGSLTPIPDTTIFSWFSHTNTRHNNPFLAL